MQTKALVIKNTGSQIIGKIVSGGTTFLVSILLARALGPVGFGDFTKITTYIPIFYLLNDFGLNAAYLTIRTKSNRPGLFSSLCVVRIAVSLLLVFVSLAITIFLPGVGGSGYHPLVKIGIILFAPSILFQAIITTANALFQEHLSYEKSTLSVVIGSLVTLGFIFFISPLFVPDASLLMSIIALLIGSGLTALFSFFLARPFLKEMKFTFSQNDIRLLLWSALPLGVTLLTNVIYFHADSIILTVARPTSEVGFYGLAYKLFEFPLAVPTFFMNAMFPLFLKAKSDPILLRRRMIRAIIILSGVGLLGSVAGWILSPYLTYIRADFSQSIPLFRILIVGLPIFFLTSFTMWTLVTFEKRWLLCGIYAIFMMINIIANLICIPTYGATASAYITILSELGILVVSGYAILKMKKQ
jgi:O-antigen/teichoic acid export membrane protein